MLKRFPVSQGRLMSAIEDYMDGVAKRISGRAGSMGATERAKLYGMEQLARGLGVDCSCFTSKWVEEGRGRLVCRCRPMTAREKREARPYLTGSTFTGRKPKTKKRRAKTK